MFRIIESGSWNIACQLEPLCPCGSRCRHDDIHAYVAGLPTSQSTGADVLSYYNIISHVNIEALRMNISLMSLEVLIECVFCVADCSQSRGALMPAREQGCQQGEESDPQVRAM